MAGWSWRAEATTWAAYGLDGYGLDGYGPDGYGLGSYGLDGYGLGSYGLDSYGRMVVESRGDDLDSYTASVGPAEALVRHRPSLYRP